MRKYIGVVINVGRRSIKEKSFIDMEVAARYFVNVPYVLNASHIYNI